LNEQARRFAAVIIAAEKFSGIVEVGCIIQAVRVWVTIAEEEL